LVLDPGRGGKRFILSAGMRRERTVSSLDGGEKKKDRDPFWAGRKKGRDRGLLPMRKTEGFAHEAQKTKAYSRRKEMSRKEPLKTKMDAPDYQKKRKKGLEKAGLGPESRVRKEKTTHTAKKEGNGVHRHVRKGQIGAVW